MGVYSAYVHSYSRHFEHLDSQDNFLFCATSISHSVAQKQQKEWDLNFLLLGQAGSLVSSLLAIAPNKEKEESLLDEEIGCALFVYSALRGVVWSWVRREVLDLADFPAVDDVIASLREDHRDV